MVIARDIEMALADVDRLELQAAEGNEALSMDEEGFRAFYDRTARPLWAYLAKTTGDRDLADDLLQDAYYRLLRAQVVFEGETHRRRYLFRIATNLVLDARRRRAPAQPLPLDDHPDALVADPGAMRRPEERSDLSRALAGLKPRDRAMLWLAYAEGSSHREIAEALGLKAAGIKVLLFRARRKLAALLRPGPKRGMGS
jgi:RNA polymerase sigma-70 factor (ECF subfamily)